MTPSPGDVVERWDHGGVLMTPYVVVALAHDEELGAWMVEVLDPATGLVHPWTLACVREFCSRRPGEGGVVAWQLVPFGALP